MGFWTNPQGFDPKRKYNWILQHGGPTGFIPAWVCKKVTKPGWSTTEATHRYLNYTFYYPGKVEWDEITLSLVDPVDPDMAEELYKKILMSSGWKMPDNAGDIHTMSKTKAVEALGLIQISQVDHDGLPLETWQLQNAWVKSAKFGELDYEGDELAQIDVTLRYDWAELITSGGGFSRSSGAAAEAEAAAAVRNATSFSAGGSKQA